MIKTTFNRLLFCTIMLTPLIYISGWWGLVVILPFYIFSFQYIRVNDVFIFNCLTRNLSMNLLKPSNYRTINYINNKEYVKEIFRKDCVNSLIILADKYDIKEVSFNTHSWIIRNILKDEDIVKRYDVSIISVNKKTNLLMQIIPLVSYENYKILKEKQFERSIYKVKFKRI